MADELECTVSAIADFAQFGYATACDYVQTACADETQIVDFFGLYYCQLNESVPAFVVISFLFVLFIFYMISSTAEDYIEPVVSQISTKLRLSESLAGVTLVALANGAPDVIAAFAAGGNEDQGVLVPLGGLLGAGIFTISMILAVCILFSPSKTIKTEKSALTRDCVFYLIGALYVLGLGIYGEINLWGTMGFFAQYCVFLGVVLYQEAQYRKNLNNKALMKSDGPSFVLEYGQDVEFEDHNLLHSLMKDNHVKGEKTGINYDESVMSAGLPGSKVIKATNTNLRWRYNILKHNVWREFEEVEDSGIFGKILYVLLYPFKLVRDLTIPATSSENWSKWKTVLQPFFLLPFFVWQAGYLEDLMASKTAVIVFVSSCFVISALLWKFTATKNPPSGLFGLAMMGLAFSSGVVWINLVANMLVDFIALLAVFTNLPLNFLGLTLVAFGGSVPDFFVDLTLAKKGLGQTAASGIFAGQYFNLGIGFGAALTRQVLVYGPRPFQLFDGSNTAIINLVLVGCLVGGLIVALGYGKFQKYIYGKGFATYSLFLYAAFLGSVTFLSF